MTDTPTASSSVATDFSTGRTFLFAVLSVAVSILICLLVAEIALRFLPVATGMWSMPVSAQQPVFRFTPNREFLFSRDWDFSIVNRGHINKDGFVNDEDYSRNDPRPLPAVGGDSFVEAAMVPNRQTFYRRLADQLGNRGRVYSFGASGAPLSQYLVWARYATETYRPAGLAILVVGNDFDESIWSYGQKVGMHFYVKGADGRLELRRFDHRPSLLRHLVRHSALGRYLVFHLHVLESIGQLTAWLGLGSPAFAATPDYGGNAAAAAPPERVRDSHEAIAAFLDDLPRMAELAPDRIVFLLEGARYQDMVEATERSYVGLMRARFTAEAS